MIGRRYYRVDPRLVHATTVNTWVPALNAKIALVVDAGVALDPKRRAISETSAMGSIEVRFCDAKNAPASVAACPPDRCVLVLFSCLEDVEAAMALGLEMERLNIGHLPAGPGKTALHPAVHLGEDDMAWVRGIQARGVQVSVQPLPHDKLRLIEREAQSDAPAPDTGAPSSRVEAKLEIVNEKGLHLRAAHVLAALTTGLKCDVRMGVQPKMVNGKSLLGLTTLGATCGTVLDVVLDGEGAEAGLEAMRALFASGFEEGAA